MKILFSCCCKIKTFSQNVSEENLFEDPDFPANNDSLFYSERPAEELEKFSWVRPHQLGMYKNMH